MGRATTKVDVAALAFAAFDGVQRSWRRTMGPWSRRRDHPYTSVIAVRVMCPETSTSSVWDHVPLGEVGRIRSARGTKNGIM